MIHYYEILEREETGGTGVQISVAQLLIGYPILTYFYPIIYKLSYILLFFCLFY